MLSFKIVILMTAAAFQGDHTIAIRTTPDVHRVTVLIISLAWKISAGVTIHTPRVMQNWDD
jgi:hypothetical protein